ncbi:unnamed protein product [Orchesella dallaii]|uniref:Uncharacterized protein n=1 Tax=Orchesella dallaii TaxID=48710 RepID=A0ABP1QHR6_9HEXA
MDFLENCSSQELRNAKNILSKYLKSAANVNRPSRQSSHAPSALRYRSRDSSEESRQSDCHLSHRNNELRRSRSLINLRDNFSMTSSNLKHASKSFAIAEKNNSVQSSSDEEFNDDALNVNSHSTSSSLASKSKRGVPRLVKGKSKDVSASISKSYIQLTLAAQILNNTLVEVQTNNASSSCNRNSSHKSKSRLHVPKLEEKDCLAKLSNIIGSLSEQLQKEIDTYTTSSTNRLEDVQNDNAILKQRLSNALNVQRNIEGELKELTRENKLLQEENKNLAMKIVPFLPDKTEQFQRRDSQQNRTLDSRNKSRHEAEIFCKIAKDTISNKDNASTLCDDEDDYVCPSLSREYCLRESSTGFETNYGQNEYNKQSSFDASKEPSRSESMEKMTRFDELDNIKLYVKSKNMDLAGLHGKLSKSESNN